LVAINNSHNDLLQAVGQQLGDELEATIEQRDWM